MIEWCSMISVLVCFRVFVLGGLGGQHWFGGRGRLQGWEKGSFWSGGEGRELRFSLNVWTPKSSWQRMWRGFDSDAGEQGQQLGVPRYMTTGEAAAGGGGGQNAVSGSSSSASEPYLPSPSETWWRYSYFVVGDGGASYTLMGSFEDYGCSLLWLIYFDVIEEYFSWCWWPTTST